jgi:hypothetical protein
MTNNCYSQTTGGAYANLKKLDKNIREGKDAHHMLALLLN